MSLLVSNSLSLLYILAASAELVGPPLVNLMSFTSCIFSGVIKSSGDNCICLPK